MLIFLGAVILKETLFYFIGGYNHSNNIGFDNYNEIFDPEKNSWIKASSIDLCDFSNVVMFNKQYITSLGVLL